MHGSFWGSVPQATDCLPAFQQAMLAANSDNGIPLTDLRWQVIDSSS